MARTADASAAPESRLFGPLTILAVIVTIVFLKYSAPVTLPLAFALFLVALLFPVYRALAAKVPNGLAAVATLLVFLTAVGALGVGLWHSGQRVAEKRTEYRTQADRSMERLRRWTKKNDLPWPSGDTQSGSLVKQVVTSVGRGVGDAVSGLVLVAAFFVLGLLEVRFFRKKIAARMSDARTRSWLEATEAAASAFQRYLLVRTGVGLITGVGVGLTAWAIGLDFPFIWGLANFLLNYIPTLGSIIGVFPPVLFAMIQNQSIGYALLALVTVGGVQLLMGNYIDPLLQGKYLELSPVVVLFSVVFWGWVWGIAGAFISIPITTAIVLVCQQFDSSRWLAELLAQSAESESEPART